MTRHEQEISAFIQDRKQSLAKTIVKRQYAQSKVQWEAYAEEGRQKSIRDAGYHLDYLAQSIASSSPELFIDYVSWVNVLFSRLDFPPDVLPTTLKLTREVLQETLPPEQYQRVGSYLDKAEAHIDQADLDLPSHLDEQLPLADTAQKYIQLLLAGERGKASRLIQSAVEKGTSIKDLYLHVFQRSQHEIGRLWQLNEISVAHEHYATAATQMIISQLYPQILTTERAGYSLVMTCVSDELHEIGARMVADFFEMEGWDTYYLGANTPTSDILATLEERDPDLLGISTTITYHLDAAEAIISAVRNTPSLQDMPILIGGRPFIVDPALWRKVGADASGRSAQEAIQLGHSLVKREQGA